MRVEPRPSPSPLRTLVRLGTPPVVLAAALACKAPVTLNEPPKLQVVQPTDGAVVNQGSDATVEINYVDDEGDSPLSRVDTSGDDVVFRDDTHSTAGMHYFPGPTTGSGRVELDIEASDGKLISTAAAAFDVNGAPTSPVIEITPTAPTPGDDLIGALVTPSVDPEGAQIAYFWSWGRGGSVFLTGSTFPAVLPSAQTSSGQTWTFRVEAAESDDGATRAEGGLSVTATASVVVANDPPTAPATVTVLPSAPHPAQPLRCEAAGATDPDGTVSGYVYGWARDNGSGFVVQAAFTDAVLPATATAPGEAWRCLARASDGAQTGPEATSADIDVALDLPPLSDADFRLDLAGAGDAVVGVPGGLWVGDATGDGRLLFFAGATLASLSPADAGDADASFTGAASEGLGADLRVCDDLDGDNLPDLLARSDAAEPTLDVLRGAAPAASSAASALATRLTPAAGVTGFGLGLAVADLDDDGNNDLIVAEALDALTAHKVLVFDGPYTGPATRLSTSASRSLTGDAAGLPFGTGWSEGAALPFATALDAGLDVDGDGIGDVLVGSNRSGFAGHLNDDTAAFLFSGAQVAAGTVTGAAGAYTVYEHAAGRDAGASVALYPDVSGDSRAEVVVGVPGFPAGAEVGRIGLFFSGAAALSTEAFGLDNHDVWIQALGDGERFGTRIVKIELDGDGLPELAIEAPGAASGAGRVYLFLGADIAAAAATATPGSPVRLDTDDAAWVLAGESAVSPLRVFPTADLDGDGYGDLVVGSSASGRVWVWLSAE